MPIPAPILCGVTRAYPLGSLLTNDCSDPKASSERHILGLPLPPWQRGEVWTHLQKQRFLEGIFLGLGCGTYCKNGQEWLPDGSSAPMSGWLIDGQQRISAIRDFLAGDLVIFGDVTFPAMSKAERLRFSRTPFPCLELDYCADETALVELYNRLNFGGTPHKANERAFARSN